MVDEQKSKDEQIGFHKGALSTLAKEREEMIKIVSVVEQLMQMHISALKELGVDLVSEAQKVQGNQQNPMQNPGSKEDMENKLKDWKL
jgi:RNA processing factor Prp31